MQNDFKFPDRIQLANLPTPIYRLDKLSKELEGPEIYIKRDDLTGLEFSGNKIRKLEFICARAVGNGNNVLITCGGLQSNHARATAAAAARLGLRTHLVLYGPSSGEPTANYWLDLLFGARITLIPVEEKDSLSQVMADIASDYLRAGDKPLIIPLGASDAAGCWGYIQAAGEISSQCQQMGGQPDAIFVPTGSGGTQAGLMIGKELFGLKSRIIGICVSENSSYFQAKISGILQDFSTIHPNIPKPQLTGIEVIDGYIGEGYGCADQSLLQFIAHIARLESILLDPVYTGKAFFGMVNEVRKGHISRESKLLFIHTGGIFGLLPYVQQLTSEISAP